MKLLLCVLLLLSLAACATVRLPLCPEIAEKSYATDARGEIINRYARSYADAKAIRIRPLSAFTAEFVGISPALKDFEKEYVYMLCAFDPRLERDDTNAVYLSCMSHAPSWIQIVQSEHPEALMREGTMFLGNCATFDAVGGER